MAYIYYTSTISSTNNVLGTTKGPPEQDDPSLWIPPSRFHCKHRWTRPI